MRHPVLYWYIYCTALCPQALCVELLAFELRDPKRVGAFPSFACFAVAKTGAKISKSKKSGTEIFYISKLGIEGEDSVWRRKPLAHF